jgi:hypothetical protein
MTLIPLTIEATTSTTNNMISTDILGAKYIKLLSVSIITDSTNYTYNSVSIELGNTISENVIDNDPNNFYLKTALRRDVVTGKNYSYTYPMVSYESIGPITKQLRCVIRDPLGVPLAANQLDYAFLQFQIYTEDFSP